MKRSMQATYIVGILLMEGLAHLDIYHAVVDIFGIPAQYFPALQILIALLWVSLIASSLLSAKYNNIFTRVFFQIAAVWLGFLLYFFLASCLYALIILVFGMEHAHGDLQPYGAALFAIATLVTIYGFYHGQNIKIKKLELSLKNLPTPWQNKNIVFISDLHLGHVLAEHFAEKVTRKINSLNPDLILIGGDLYDGLKVDPLKIIEPLKNLKSTHGTYFITGNHDGFSEIATEQDLTAVKETGIITLDNELVNLGGLQLIGVDYRQTTTVPGLTEVLQRLNIEKEVPSIMMKHVPSLVEVAEKFGISLLLCGHTHRAQAWPLSYIPGLIYKKYAYGINKLNEMQVYTSSGVGTYGPPMRVGTDSEIVLINLVSSSQLPRP
jgi:predicted MPP superfamily phosphohydrolase